MSNGKSVYDMLTELLRPDGNYVSISGPDGNRVRAAIEALGLGLDEAWDYARWNSISDEMMIDKFLEGVKATQDEAVAV